MWQVLEGSIKSLPDILPLRKSTWARDPYGHHSGGRKGWRVAWRVFFVFFRKLMFYQGSMSEAMVFTSSPCVPPHFPAALDMRLGSLDWFLLDRNVGRDSPTFKNTLHRTSLVDQWLRFCTSSAGGLGSIPGQETRSYMPQLRVCTPQQKIPYATTKTQCRQMNNFFIKIK